MKDTYRIVNGEGLFFDLWAMCWWKIADKLSGSEPGNFHEAVEMLPYAQIDYPQARMEEVS